MLLLDNLILLIISAIFGALGILLFYFIKRNLTTYDTQFKELIANHNQDAFEIKDSFDKKLEELIKSNREDTNALKDSFREIINLVNVINTELTRSTAAQDVRNIHVSSQISTLFEKSEKTLGLITVIEREQQKINMTIEQILEKVK
jgi:hypothetical protein